MPYAKRIKSGAASTGDTVQLCQWYCQPEITLSIKKLGSYNAANAASDQDWCVFHDAVQCYDNGGGDFGWQFDVHAKLVISGGTRTECVYNVNFDVTQIFCDVRLEMYSATFENLSSILKNLGFGI